MTRAVIAVLVMCSGCAMGGRLTGGVLADRSGVSPFAGASLEIGMLDRGLGRASVELGGTMTKAEPTTRVGVRHRPRSDRALGRTASAAIDVSRTEGFALVSAGLSYQHPELTDESPDVLAGYMFGLDVEAIAGLGGHELSDVYPRVGAQLSIGFMHFTLMR